MHRLYTPLAKYIHWYSNRYRLALHLCTDKVQVHDQISFCMDIGECDEDLIFEKVCPVAFINDADILQKTIVQEIERGGVFIDRIRVFEFFDFIQMCLNRDLNGRPANDKSFLDTYKDEIDFIRNFPR